MSRSFPWSGLPLLCLAILSASACSSGSSGATGPTALTVESGTGSSLTAEPATLRPEFLPDLSCSNSRPFGTRIIVVVSGGSQLSLRALRFRFVDRFGISALPNVRVIPGSSPMTVPVTMIPPLMGIPIPGLAPAPASTMSQLSNAQRFPFFLAFGCGLSANGVVSVGADTIDGMGRAATRELSVPMR